MVNATATRDAGILRVRIPYPLPNKLMGFKKPISTRQKRSLKRKRTMKRKINKIAKGATRQGNSKPYPLSNGYQHYELLKVPLNFQISGKNKAKPISFAIKKLAPFAYVNF